MKNFNWKKLLPHITAVAVFLILTISYFSPLLKGYILDQGDIRQGTGMSKEIRDHRVLYEEEPYWTGSAFSGMPAFQLSAYYPHDYIDKLNFLINFFSLKP